MSISLKVQTCRGLASNKQSPSSDCEIHRATKGVALRSGPTCLATKPESHPDGVAWHRLASFRVLASSPLHHSGRPNRFGISILVSRHRSSARFFEGQSSDCLG